jgi:hypothetical protein
MFRRTMRHRPAGPVRPYKRRRGDLGLWALATMPEPTAVGPATSATWAWSLRRFGRWMVLGLPGYALISGLVSLSTRHRGAAGLYLPDGPALHLVAWVGAAWIGLMALMALAALLAATRTRRAALLALMAGAAGLLAMLPFAGLPGQATVYGAAARWYVLAGATVYSVGWALAGSAVARSGVLNFGDGVLLMLAAPLLGVAGLLIDPLQTIGAVLVFAAGIGIVLRAGRLLPVGRRGIAAAAAAQAVAAAAATTQAVTAAATQAVTAAATQAVTAAAADQAAAATQDVASAAEATSSGAGKRSLAAW